jgi:hypothetical protein
LANHCSSRQRWRRNNVAEFQPLGGPGNDSGLPCVLAARGRSRAELRAALFRQLCVENSRNITDIPTISRLDLAKNDSLSLAPDFYHGLLGHQGRALQRLRSGSGWSCAPTPDRLASRYGLTSCESCSSFPVGDRGIGCGRAVGIPPGRGVAAVPAGYRASSVTSRCVGCLRGS